ncbi:hypothetical protein K7X08_009725 [Anisodus acutangulus]|uniref:Uncharacterized protein n=1 Tax=Anisodus acutangulus TaxID=402998 RepID=A0A9Q1RTS2_9SOLA|nr:hypothetical protein K7X08_009725 [Anisodus acutangulus]
MSKIQYPMNPPGPPPFGPPLPPPLPAFPPASSTFWNAANVADHLKNLHDTVNLATAFTASLMLVEDIRTRTKRVDLSIKLFKEDIARGPDIPSMDFYRGSNSRMN